MKPRDILDLTLLAALWGGSFIFMRVAAPEFGPIAMIELRVALAALFLLPILLLRNGSSEIRTHWKALFIVGALNSAMPFCLFGYATLYLAGGFASIVNAASPLWGTAIRAPNASTRAERRRSSTVEPRAVEGGVWAKPVIEYLLSTHSRGNAHSRAKGSFV